MQRRQFLLSSAAAWAWGRSLGPRSLLHRIGRQEAQFDLVILGGGTGGCAAALAATRAGLRVAMTEPTDWIGGQLTSQGVPPDENGAIETGGANESYRQLRTDVRDAYRAAGLLSEKAAGTERLNPGSGNVSRLCAEPGVWWATLRAHLEPAVAAGRLVILEDTRLEAAEMDGDRLQSVRVSGPAGQLDLRAPWFLDATEEGDLYPLAGIEYILGAESRQQTGEPHALEEPEPQTLQAPTWCCALAYEHGQDHRGDAPDRYAFWRDYIPALEPAWTGPLLSWQATHPISLEPRTFHFHPTGSPGELPGWPNLWTYRQIVDPAKFRDPRPAVTVVNWPQNDYLLGNIISSDPSERERHLRGAREVTLALVHWLQNDAPRPDGGTGWPGVRLAPEAMGTADGLAKAVYVREGRRLQSRRTIVEQHVSPELRMEETGASREEVRAAAFYDSVGIGHYRIDLHPTPSGRNYLDVDCLRFQIPLGALLPQRVENVIAAGKGIGTTHITNGAYRLHPVEWGIGEAAGSLAAFCTHRGLEPHAVGSQSERLAEFQKELQDSGVPLSWS